MIDRIIASFDGARLAVRDEGAQDRPAVLLSHYLGGAIESWDPQVEALLSAGFRVVRYDSRGHGRSDAPGDAYSNDMLARDALAVLDALAIGRAHFVGISKGGMTGIRLAVIAPERIDRLVVANSTPFIPNKAICDGMIERARAEGMAALAEGVIGSWLSPGFSAREAVVRAATVGVMAAMSRRGLEGSVEVLRTVDLREALAEVNVPTLVIAGEEDGLRVAGAEAIAAGIPGAELVRIPAAAHLSNIENPMAFNAAMIGFLARISTSG